MICVHEQTKSTPTRTISGRSLVHQHLNARQKAAIAADILDGADDVKPTAVQISRMVGVSVSYIAIARKWTAAKRAAIRNGAKFPKPAPLLKIVPTAPVVISIPVSDAEVDAMIREAGVDRILARACEIEKALIPVA
jgi:hypothetical protein